MSARDELYQFATVAFRETGVPPLVHDTVTKLLDAYRGEVRAEEADLIVAHCPWHSDNEGTWLACHCPVADEMRRRSDPTKAARMQDANATLAASKTTVSTGLPGLFERLGPPDTTT